MIVIEAYNPRWPEEFEVIRASLQTLLGVLALRIDHVGSTAVPGLGAKDVIDVQITVRALTADVRDALIQAGYRFQASATHDHVLLAECDDPHLWERFTFLEPEGLRRAHVYARVDGHRNQRYTLLFRDYLRTHPYSARAIEVIKRELAKRHPHDVAAYYDIKDPVYELVWDAALAWAENTGWTAG